MINALIKLDERSNRVLNIIKAQLGLRNKSEAVQVAVQAYETEHLEPELRPSYVARLKELRDEESVEVTDFTERYGLP
ncbi:MAG: antitoxin [Euryarchaeota archaeon]|jgi:hypothetical protein|nr:antitoxin [Euryarchaeota archaeon]MDP6658275.1 DUF2683 family protein [Candidatus Poseidoniia archaeon]MDP6847092.1 DUF2683 family protein [Candidatus Poseidoniia archaeon]|tara:strand:- start:94 stop:327 length:234 start_codon:yes stop_codon:yes gene_type:complete